MTDKNKRKTRAEVVFDDRVGIITNRSLHQTGVLIKAADFKRVEEEAIKAALAHPQDVASAIEMLSKFLKAIHLENPSAIQARLDDEVGGSDPV